MLLVPTQLELAHLLSTSEGQDFTSIWHHSDFHEVHQNALPCWHTSTALSELMQVQDAMARITLDVIMATGFDLPSNAVDLDKACPLLEDMHFLMAETFR